MVSDSVVLSERPFKAVPDAAKKAYQATKLVVLKAKLQLRREARSMSDEALLEAYLGNLPEDYGRAKAYKEEIFRRFRLAKTRNFWK